MATPSRRNDDRIPGMGSAGAPGLRSLLLWGAAGILLSGCVSDAPLLTGSGDGRPPAVLPPAPAGGYDLDRPYPLLPGDKVSITVRDDPDLNIDLVIPPDGSIEVWKSEKNGGERQRIQARGLTVTELRDAIAAVYQKTLFESRPYVQVTLAQAVPRVVYVRGAVKSAGSGTDTGVVSLPETGSRLTLFRAIQAAGGVNEDADLTRVAISRKDPATGAEVSLPTFDLETMQSTVSYDRDPPLEPNDIITVPVLGRVWITGNINQPGDFLLLRGMTLTKLIAKAGGLKPFSKLRDIRVMRGEGTTNYRAYRVDYADVLDGKAPDPLLQSEDRVNIEEDWK
jgi:polysaccharide biosynthesis/export protein